MWFLVVVLSVYLAEGTYAVDLTFPPGFKFGAATAAYQVEGAWNVSDKGESIWDRSMHKLSSTRGFTGDVACDSYHLWEKDIEIAANMSLDFYRFSIAWPRLLPNGFPNYVSEDGKEYYNKLIDGLLAKGIEPVVTLYHWDLPQRLQDLGGWTNPHVVDWFADYADIAFSLYGDRVKTWITLNEPVVFCDVAYNSVWSLNIAPGIKDEIAPYLCGKNILLAHAMAYRLYDKKYRQRFDGKISIANNLVWIEPLTDAEKELAEICVEYHAGQYSHPIFSKEGGWSKVYEDVIAKNSRKEGFPSSKLLPFTAEEINFVKGTFDFFGMNHYTSRTARKVKPGEEPVMYPLSGVPELGVIFESRPEWKGSTSTWLFQYPQGLRKQMAWIKKKYGDIPILITENGFSTSGGSWEEDERVQYYKDYLKQVLLSIKEDGVNVIGYTAWSLMDNLEWWYGYGPKFGLYEVDFSDPLRPRTPRKSAQFYADLIRTRSLEDASNKTELQ